jgi:hypothetical protein
VSTAYESATLLIKLYELRREATMRDARNWFARSFHPSTIEDVMQTMSGPNSAHFRMVTSYWDMAASFVINDAIDEQMFVDANGEHLGVYAKLEPLLGDIRARMGNPRYLANLEKLIDRTPGAKERLPVLREFFRAMVTAAGPR